MFIQTDTLEKNGAHGAAMHVHKYWGCLQICWQRAENTHKFSADLLIRNALYWWQTLAFVKWFDVLKDKTGPNSFCCTLRLWKRASVCCGGLCSCVMDSAWQSALRQQLRTEKASQGNIKHFKEKRKKGQISIQTQSHYTGEGISCLIRHCCLFIYADIL